MVRLPNRPKRDLEVAVPGLGARRDGLAAVGCGWRGRKSAIIPSPEGAGVPSRGDGCTGLGDGPRDPCCERDLKACCGGVNAVREIALRRRSCGGLKLARLLWMIAMDSPNCSCRSGAPSLLGRRGCWLLTCETKGKVRGLDGDESEEEVITDLLGAFCGLDGDSSCSGGDFLNF